MSPGHDDGVDFDPEHETDIPSGSGGRDRTQSPPRAQPRSQAQTRNGRQPATDPATQRKRRLCDEISLATKGTGKRKKSEQVSFIISRD